MIGTAVVGTRVVGTPVVGTWVVGTAVEGRLVGAAVFGRAVGATVVGGLTAVGTAVGVRVVGTDVVGRPVVGTPVVGRPVVGAEVVGRPVLGAIVVGLGAVAASNATAGTATLLRDCVEDDETSTQNRPTSRKCDFKKFDIFFSQGAVGQLPASSALIKMAGAAKLVLSLHPSSFVSADATLRGNITIGPKCFIHPKAVLDAGQGEA